MNTPIGGYFELELSHSHKYFPHSKGMLLNSGRHSLEYILRSIGKIKRLWIPFFTCDVIMQPIEHLHVPFSFYHVNFDFTLAEEIPLTEDEYILYTNYYGVMDAYCKTLAVTYGSHLIIDNAQALYAEHIKGVNTFYSPRKFVGVPDGGVAYSNKYDENLPLPKDLSYARCSHLLKRHELTPSEGYQDFRNNSKMIAESPMAKMSSLTERLLLSIDYEYIRKRRLLNFNYLNKRLSSLNQLQIPPIHSFECPLVYPLFVREIELKKFLIKNDVFVATYWPNIFDWCKEGDVEFDLASRIVALPVDQRYNEEEMDIMVELIDRFYTII